MARGCVLVCLGMATLIALVTLEVVDLSAGAGIFVSCQQAASVYEVRLTSSEAPIESASAKDSDVIFFCWPCPYYCTFIVLKGKKFLKAQ